MSTVHVFVGQCGNQLGTAFLDALASEAEASKNEDYQMRVSVKHFRPPMQTHHNPSSRTRKPTGGSAAIFDKTAPLKRLPQPRCVMVDMEPKVIEEAIKRVNGVASPITSLEDSTEADNRNASYYCLAPQQCVTRGEGSANNWAYGYYEQGESRREAIAECLRRESESTESGAAIRTYHVVHSVAGGTGSGVGCLVAEVVKDVYPHASLLHSIVWPFSGGEVATQWYNTVLCMSSLRDTTDAVCVAYNDVVTDRLSRAQRAAVKGGARVGPDTSVSYEDINRQIGRLWAPLHLPQLLYDVPPPVRDLTKNRIPQASVIQSVPQAPLPQPRRFAVSEDIIEAMALDPARKFFTGTSVPYHAVVRESLVGTAAGTSSWSAVLTDAARTSREAFGASGVMGFAGSSALWMLRGRGATTEGVRALQDVLATEQNPCLGTLFVSPDVGQPKASSTPALTDGRPTHETSIYGHAPVISSSLKVALQRAEQQLEVGAYAHQFSRHGVDKDTLTDCCARLWDTVYAYDGGVVS